MMTYSPNNIYFLTLAIILSPAIAAGICGVAGQIMGRKAAHRLAITGLAVSLVLSLIIGKWILLDNHPAYTTTLYTWGVTAAGHLTLTLGILIDRLSALMMIVVTFVSLLVHIYTIGYMAEDDGYQRFFSYISLFTFAMLMLVTANNFLQLFFGWEGVGLASYLLISFWFKRDSATAGGIKAFLVNRVGHERLCQWRRQWR